MSDQVPVRIVDCDVHLVPTSRDELLDRMPEPWRSRMGSRRANATGKATYVSFEKSKRRDSFPPGGGLPGSDPAFVYDQLFGDSAVDLAMVIPEGRYTVDPELNTVWCAAHNAWLSETWLDTWNLDGRLYGSICVSTDDVDGAVRQIEEWAPNPRFRQILVSDVSDRPLGLPQYEPIWAAAARHGLPVAMHFTGHGASVLGASAVGRYPHHVDYHSIAYPLMYSAHLVSWICNGVFDRLPDLSVVFLEGGFLWHRPIVARLARHWPALRREVQAKRDDPFDYVREHVRFTSQPIEETEDPTQVGRLFALAEADRTLMFSSDYPHYDFDEPRRAMPRGVDATLRQRVMAGNAQELYGLPATRPAQPAEVGA
jgi:uncharacterized protein